MYQQSWQFQASLWWHFREVPKRGSYSLREQELKHPRSQWFCFALGRFSFLGSRLPLPIWNVKCVRTYTLGFSYRAAEMKTSELEKLCMGGRELAFEEKDCIVSPPWKSSQTLKNQNWLFYSQRTRFRSKGPATQIFSFHFIRTLCTEQHGARKKAGNSQLLLSHWNIGRVWKWTLSVKLANVQWLTISKKLKHWTTLH